MFVVVIVIRSVVRVGVLVNRSIVMLVGVRMSVLATRMGIAVHVDRPIFVLVR